MKKQFILIFVLVTFCFGFSNPFSADKKIKEILALDLPKVFVVDERYDRLGIIDDARFTLSSADKINIIRKDDFIKGSMWLVGYSVNVELINSKPFITDVDKVSFNINNHKATIYCIAKIKKDDDKYKIVGNQIVNIALDKQPRAKELKEKFHKSLKNEPLKVNYNSRCGERE